MGLLEKLNRLLLGRVVLAVWVGSSLVFFICITFTRPLSSLLSGVAALERGDFNYALDAGGGDEVAELARAFGRMRESLFHTQQDLIESELLATLVPPTRPLPPHMHPPPPPIMPNA